MMIRFDNWIHRLIQQLIILVPPLNMGLNDQLLKAHPCFDPIQNKLHRLEKSYPPKGRSIGTTQGRGRKTNSRDNSSLVSNLIDALLFKFKIQSLELCNRGGDPNDFLQNHRIILVLTTIMVLRLIPNPINLCKLLNNR